MKILVTGGAGFIGSHIVEHYQDKAEEIRVAQAKETPDTPPGLFCQSFCYFLY